MARYEFVEGKSSKFWEIELDGDKVTTKWGRIGTKGQSKTKDLGSAAAAQKEYDKLVKSKTKKGYELVGAPDEPAAATVSAEFNPELEAAILEDPENPENYLVYADWLQAHGNPFGELIAIQVELHEKPKDKRLQSSQKKLLDTHKALFWGPLADVAGVLIEEVEWYCGFIKKAKVKSSHEYDPEFGETDKKIEMAEILDTFLELPAARFIQSLSLGIFYFYQNNYVEAAKVVGKKKRPTIRELFIGDFYYEETELNWSDAGDISPIYKALPNLRKLTVRSGTMELGKIKLPELREFYTVTGNLAGTELQNIAKAKWPKLETLMIEAGEGKVADVAPILAGKGLGELKHLGITNHLFVDDLCEALATAKILPQLETLSMSRSEMSSRGVEALLAIEHKLAHLEQLDISEQYSEDAFDTEDGTPWWEDDSVMKKLGGLAKSVALPDGEERYYPITE